MHLVFAVAIQILNLSLAAASYSATEVPRTTTPHIPGAPYFVNRPHNATVLVDEKFTLQCEVAGNSEIEVKWWHYYDEMKRRSTFHRILKSGNLRFHRILPQHQGYYICRANNSLGSIHSNLAYLRVHAPATIVQGPTSRYVKEGDIVVMHCFVGGDPESTITWKVDGKPIFDENTQKTFNKQEYRFNATRTQKIECTAENRNIRGYSNDTRQATVHVTEIPRGYCQAYNGTICRSHIGNRTVFYNLSSPTNIAAVQEVAVFHQWKRLISSVSPTCQKAVTAVFCEAAFPACVERTKLPTKQQICKEHCKAIQNYFCVNDWETILDIFNAAGVYLPSSCSHLPSIHSSEDTSRHSNKPRPIINQEASCSKLGIFQVEPIQVTTTCYHGDGRYYEGAVNVTEQHYPCQSWDDDMPHIHPFLMPSNFPILVGAGSRCRNPGGLRSRPWCYILSSGSGPSWQHCDVPMCVRQPNGTGKKFAQQRPLKQKLDDFFSKDMIIIVVFVALVTISLIVLTVLFFYQVWRHNKKIRYKPAYQRDIDIDIEKLPSNECYNRQSIDRLSHPILDKVQYPRNDIVFMKDIGRGAFGRVFQAKAPNINKDEESTVVVVKMLKDEASEDMQANFEMEAALLVELDHVNIIRLLGACAIGKPVCLLFEYMGNGDLTEFLRSCSPERLLMRNRSTDVLSPSRLSHFDQLYIAEQICSAMVYLSNLGYVHRDLATRNCLVGEELLVKISDFSLVRCVDDKDGLYIGRDEDEVPIRWMPLEAIMYNRFSVSSDVWSFGVVLWEIFAYARQPYHDMDHEEILRFIHDGQILSCPDDTPPTVYDLMEICWDMEAKHRPPFEKLEVMLSSIRNELEHEFDSDSSKSLDRV